MSRLTVFALPVLLLTVAPLAAAAQSPRLRRWEVSLTGGRTWGRSSGTMEQAMRDGGLGDTYLIPAGCYFIGCTDHDITVAYPYSVRGDETRTLAVSYALRSWLRVRAQYGTADLGWTSGHREPVGHLQVSQRVSTVAALVLVGEGVYLGAGPSMSSVRVGTEWPEARSVGRLGAVVHAGLRIPERKRFFISATVQYHYIGSADVGPYTVPYTWTSDSTVVMPRTRVPSSYRALWLGIGVAL